MTFGAATSGLSPGLWYLNWMRFCGSVCGVFVNPSVSSFFVCLLMMVLRFCFSWVYDVLFISVVVRVCIQCCLHVKVYVLGILSPVFMTICWWILLMVFVTWGWLMWSFVGLVVISWLKRLCAMSLMMLFFHVVNWISGILWRFEFFWMNVSSALMRFVMVCV